MLMNNLDPEVAEKPGELVVYGGIGRAARDWDSFDRIVATLKRLEGDQTLLVQSGKPVGVFRTHADAPRVLIANSNLVPHWATWDHFNELDRKGLMMYGQMTAGSWIYIGSQGIVQGTYETFVEVGPPALWRRPLRASGSSPPASAAWAARSRSPRPWPAPRCLAVECQPSRIELRLRTGYVDGKADTLDEALAIIDSAAKATGRPSRSACSAMPPKSSPSWCAAASSPTSSPTRPPRTIRVNGYLPKGWTAGAVGGARASATRRRSRRPPSASMADACARHARLPPAWACRPSTTATTSARWRRRRASSDAFDFPGFVPAYIRPLFCRGIGPFRWAALSGDPEDIYKTDAEGEGAAARQHASAQLARHGARAHHLPGPAGAHLLGRPRRPPSPRPRLQRDGGEGRAEGARS